MQRTHLIIIVLFVFFIGCNQATKKQKNGKNSMASKDTIIDTLSQSFQSIVLENGIYKLVNCKRQTA